MWFTLMGIRPLSPVERCFCQERLGYFTADGEEGVRVDFCEASRRYLKTVDLRVLETPAPLDLEHLATLHLDPAAADRGYRPPGT